MASLKMSPTSVLKRRGVAASLYLRREKHLRVISEATVRSAMLNIAPQHIIYKSDRRPRV